jgi:hypothetical protein
VGLEIGIVFVVRALIVMTVVHSGHLAERIIIIGVRFSLRPISLSVIHQSLASC